MFNVKNSPGFLHRLQQQLESLSKEDLNKICRDGGLDPHDMISLILKPKDTSVDAEDVIDEVVVNVKKTEEKIGIESIKNGETAVIAVDESFDEKCLGYEIKNFSRLTNSGMLEKYKSVSLNPDYSLAIDSKGQTSFHDCGTGDLIALLRNEDILNSFISSGAKYFAIVSSIISPSTLGNHIENKSTFTCLVSKQAVSINDGVLCDVCGDHQIVNSRRIMNDVRQDKLYWVSSGMSVFDCTLDLSLVKQMWHREQRTVDNKLVIQFIRHFQDDMTSTFKTSFVTTDA